MRKYIAGVLLLTFVSLLMGGCPDMSSMMEETSTMMEPMLTACGSGADPNCDFCWVIDGGAGCPDAWIGDGDCDCGCQFPDQQDCTPAVPDPPTDTCPSGCRQGSVCCTFPFCGGNCIGSPCCN